MAGKTTFSKPNSYWEGGPTVAGARPKRGLTTSIKSSAATSLPKLALGLKKGTRAICKKSHSNACSVGFGRRCQRIGILRRKL